MVSASLLHHSQTHPTEIPPRAHVSGGPVVQKHDDSRCQRMYHVRTVHFYRLIKSSIELTDEDEAMLLIPFFRIDGR
jgi:hypothetical protein